MLKTQGAEYEQAAHATNGTKTQLPSLYKHPSQLHNEKYMSNDNNKSNLFK